MLIIIIIAKKRIYGCNPNLQVKGEVDKIKGNPKMTEREVNAMYDSLLRSINAERDRMKKMIADQKIREEQERMRALQEQMERERKAKEEEERKQR